MGSGFGACVEVAVEKPAGECVNIPDKNTNIVMRARMFPSACECFQILPLAFRTAVYERLGVPADVPFLLCNP